MFIKTKLEISDLLNLALVGFVLFLLVLTGCATDSSTDFSKDPTCTVAAKADGAVITCPDGSSQVIANGTDGYTVVSTVIAATSAQCPDGGSVIVLGTDVNRDGTLDVGDTNIQSTIVCNGAQGATGPAGSNGANGDSATIPPFTPVAVIQPCPESTYAEALLGLEDGSIFASYAKNGDADTVRNTLLPDGTYEGVDDSKCKFTVSTDASNNRTVQWNDPIGAAYYSSSGQNWTITD